MKDESSKRTISELKDLLRHVEERTKSAPFKPREPVSLQKAAPGREVVTQRGGFWLVEDEAKAFLNSQAEFEAATDLFFRRGEVNRAFLASVDALSGIADVEPGRLLFLDIETAGFHGAGLFLIGLMTFENGRFVVRQLLARNYAEEAAIIEHVGEFYRSCGAVVTFNGRAFDLPMIADRAVVHRVSLPRFAKDVDLLPAARRVWKKVLPDCRLVTLESFVCGRRRTGDVPSHMIPKLYHEFVENGDAFLLADVIRHNALDLIAMAHLLAAMANG
jgi:uncharacterized protein YprB with RNaseH-like and TPR domain